MVWFYNLGTSIVVGLLMLPLWFSKSLIDSSIQIVVSTIGLPVILAVLNLILFLRGKNRSFLSLYFIVPVACLLNQLVEYISWGISTGSLLYPDGETVDLMALLSVIAVGLSLLLLTIAHAILKIFQPRYLGKSGDV